MDNQHPSMQPIYGPGGIQPMPIYGPGGIQPIAPFPYLSPWARYVAAREQCDFGAPFVCSANQWAFVNSLDPIHATPGRLYGGSK
jgi:hypothetical protein